MWACRGSIQAPAEMGHEVSSSMESSCTEVAQSQSNPLSKRVCCCAHTFGSNLLQLLLKCHGSISFSCTAGTLHCIVCTCDQHDSYVWMACGA
jgi:hypothetical protein